MKEARYVIRIAPAHPVTPSEQGTLLDQVRAVVKPLGGSALNLRVSRQAIEFDLFCAPNAELHSFLTALETLGKTLTYKRIDGPSAPMLPAHVIAEARHLFKEERYWEVHEVLEGLWKTAAGSEKQLLQGLILAAAALVHVQKNEPRVVFPMLEDAVQRLENQPAVYLGLDIARFRRELQKIIATKTIHFPIL
jgi:hypothetical protein